MTMMMSQSKLEDNHDDSPQGSWRFGRQVAASDHQESGDDCGRLVATNIQHAISFVPTPPIIFGADSH